MKTADDTRAEGAIWEAFRKGAMFALGRAVWDDADDYFTLVGIDYAKGKPIPTNPHLATQPAAEPEGDPCFDCGGAPHKPSCPEFSPWTPELEACLACDAPSPGRGDEG